MLHLMVSSRSELIGMWRSWSSWKWPCTAGICSLECRSGCRGRLLEFRKADCQLFREIVSGTLWETAPGDKGAEPSWQIFKFSHGVQELAIPRSKKWDKQGKKVWWSREMLVKLKGKKQMHKKWKLRVVIWEECREVWLSRKGVRRAKAKLELNLQGMQRITGKELLHRS